MQCGERPPGGADVSGVIVRVGLEIRYYALMKIENCLLSINFTNQQQVVSVGPDRKQLCWFAEHFLILGC